ncbi:DUF6378 domain-containing protein [Timonella sp. A28]|uniref:DUF6378 domain-containing protein n=1 Tax=Timonella sp. A28 TaxID=3442640 RepID=UPI003EB949DA
MADLTTAVEVAAKARLAASTNPSEIDWESLHPSAQFSLKEQALPIVTALHEAGLLQSESRGANASPIRDIEPEAKRSEVLKTASSLISGDRAAVYGDACENFKRIAELWEPILGVNVTATQVGLCLTQLKVARIITAPQHEDSFVDAAGYIALTAEIALNES